ncbi:MAG TPA: hypothetical protein DHW02_14235 [Ktedonobacter sp.]|nr:hypothetical protein [Ktedonobacter sp.]
MAGIVEHEARAVVKWQGMRGKHTEGMQLYFSISDQWIFDDCGMGGYVVDGKEKGSDTRGGESCGEV